jgi:hypothetical protein
VIIKRQHIVEHYTADRNKTWDDFVAASRNATFLLRRGYMDYHSDRFTDRSLMIYRSDGDRRRLIALFAACDGNEGEICAHAGLTYGGLVMSDASDGAEILEVIRGIISFYRCAGYRIMRYKAVPHIYHSRPAEEDIYALFRCGARLSECNLSSTIDLRSPIAFNENSRRNMRRALRSGVTIAESRDFEVYWQVLENLLDSRYGTKPVHSAAEIAMLASRFPRNIRLFVALNTTGTVIAGTVIYVTEACVHAQYIAASPEGKSLGALPLLFDTVIGRHCGHARYFDFGTSNEDHGRYLNEGLIMQKNGMGGRGVTYNTYVIDLSHPAPDGQSQATTSQDN